MIRVVFLFSLINIAVSVRNDNLVAVVQIYRHGHRTPNRFYANDPYKNQSYWDGVPMGELTQRGVLDQYALGQFTRNRYADWLPKKYSENDLFVISTNTTRSHRSAMSNINGLYSEDTDLFKIIIHDSVNKTLLGHTPLRCKPYYVERANMVSQEAVTKIDNKYSDTYAYIAKYSGNNVNNCIDLLYIYESLDIEEALNLSLPNWTKKIYPEPIAHLVGISAASYAHTSRQQRLSILDQYALGQFTRHRYADWLPKIYSKEDFYVTSTNVARCRASAVSNINGLYSEDIDRNKIPINYSINRTLAGHAPMSCRLYYKDRANLIALKEIIAIDNKYSDLYAYLTKYTGNNVTSCRDLLHIFEGLDIEEAVNLPLPDWSRKIYPEPIAHLVGISLKSYTNTSRQQRLGIGPFMKEVVDYLEKMAEDPKSSQKFQMYSCHDFNIYSILSAFGAYDPPYPIPFAASIYIELRKNDSNYYVNVFSKNKDDFKQITIRDCDFDCPLKEVREKLKDVIVDIDKREEECKEKLEFVNELAAYNYNQYFIGVVGNLSKSTTA